MRIAIGGFEHETNTFAPSKISERIDCHLRFRIPDFNPARRSQCRS